MSDIKTLLFVPTCPILVLVTQVVGCIGLLHAIMKIRDEKISKITDFHFFDLILKIYVEI
jgi:hypothetical protein